MSRLDLPQSLQHIVDNLDQDEGTPAKVAKVLADAQVDTEDLLQWTDFEHPKADSYGRKLVFKAEHFEIMVMSWNPGDFSAIHDHGHTEWGAVQIFGEAEHATFSIIDDMLVTSSREKFEPGTIIPVSHSLIHQMGNPGTEAFISLHVYGAPQTFQSITGEARLYDPVNSRIQLVNGGVFFLLPEKQIVRSEGGPQGDWGTTIRNEVEKLKRLVRMRGMENSQTQRDINNFLELVHQKSRDLTDIINSESQNSKKWKILELEIDAVLQLLKSMESESDIVKQLQSYFDLIES